MPGLPVEGEKQWADKLNQYLLGAAVIVQAQLSGRVAAAQAAIAQVNAAVAELNEITAARVGELIAMGAGTQGLALDTDGQPYFDPTITDPPTLALVLDTDGVPFIAGATP